ncbi:MAG: hypothetical protein JNM40_18400 [Myxococcales bacterium]|nr:hypothetical protein [Myxococcales bacterium]
MAHDRSARYPESAEAERAAARRYRINSLLLNLASREARKDTFERNLVLEAKSHEDDDGEGEATPPSEKTLDT